MDKNKRHEMINQYTHRTSLATVSCAFSNHYYDRTSSSSSSLNRAIQALICSKSQSGSIVVVAISLAAKQSFTSNHRMNMELSN